MRISSPFAQNVTHISVHLSSRTDSKHVYQYDHFIFPGAVPRSFVGSLFLAAWSTPFIRVLGYFGAITTKADLLLCGPFSLLLIIYHCITATRLLRLE